MHSWSAVNSFNLLELFLVTGLKLEQVKTMKEQPIPDTKIL